MARGTQFRKNGDQEKKKEIDAEDIFVASIVDELRELPRRKRTEVKNTTFRYQM